MSDATCPPYRYQMVRWHRDELQTWDFGTCEEPLIHYLRTAIEMRNSISLRNLFEDLKSATLIDFIAGDPFLLLQNHHYLGRGQRWPKLLRTPVFGDPDPPEQLVIDYHMATRLQALLYVAWFLKAKPDGTSASEIQEALYFSLGVPMDQILEVPF